MTRIKSTESRNIFVRYLIAAPILWLMFIPVVITDLFLEIYHHICFPIYGIKIVKRSQYIRIVDRLKLPYLSWPERLACAYCGYMNGWLHYASVIAGKTENYFCAISHLENRGYIPSEHEKSFTKYGDGAALRRRYAMHELQFEKEGENK